jgi:hypothetical protein
VTRRDEDDLIREEMQRLRAGIRGSAPDFQAMMERARTQAAEEPDLRVVVGMEPGAVTRRRWRTARTWGVASAALAAAVAAIALFDHGANREREFERLVAAFGSESPVWQSPTSSLLDVPGMELIRSVPDVGGSLRDIDPNQIPEIPDSEGRDS